MIRSKSIGFNNNAGAFIAFLRLTLHIKDITENLTKAMTMLIHNTGTNSLQFHKRVNPEAPIPLPFPENCNFTGKMSFFIKFY